MPVHSIKESDKVSEAVTHFKNRVFNFLVRRFGSTGAILIILLFIAPFYARGAISTAYDAFQLFRPSKDKLIPSCIPKIDPNIGSSSKLQEGVVLAEALEPCHGRRLDIIQDLDDVLDNEKPFNSDPLDPNIVTVGGSPTYQVAKRYPSGCDIPWEATYSFTPKQSDSIGVFFENEGLFKVLVGDGDRINWTLEKNDQDRKGIWTTVSKEKLQNGPISIDKEMTVIVSLKSFVGNTIKVGIKFHYVPEGKGGYVSEAYEKEITPLASDVTSDPSRPFRVGLNDWRFKGKGSEVKFGTFSVSGPLLPKEEH